MSLPRALVALGLLGAGLPAAGWAQDALAGKRLYHDVGRLRDAGASCVECHGGLPGALHGLAKAAGNPAAIEYAVHAIPQMAALRDRLTPQDMADVAAYVARPDVASPELRLATAGPAHSPWSAERLEFSGTLAGSTSASSSVRLTNVGALPLRLVSAPELAGPASGDFVIVGGDCAAGATLSTGQSCAVAVVFQPRGAAGTRTASLGIRHDWIRGAVHVALIGQVAPPRAAPPASAGRAKPREPGARH